MPASLPIEPEWTRSNWERIDVAVDLVPPRLAALARERLRAVFPPERTDELRAAAHPVVNDQFWFTSRFELLELGLALVLVPTDFEDVHRLRQPDEYEGVKAELLSALMVVRAGASVVRAPARHRQLRCEHIVELPSGERFALEAKLPRLSERSQDVMRVQFDLMNALTMRLGFLQRRLPGARGTFRFSDAILELGDRHGVHTDLVRERAKSAARRVAAAVEGRSPFQTIELEGIGALVIREEPTLGWFQFDGEGPRVAPRVLGRRITRGLLNKGARQIGSTALPGIITLDLEHDGIARNALGYLADWARRKPSLAVLLVIDRTSVDGRWYGNVDLLPGPRFDEAIPFLERTLETCPHGHLHYAALCSPAPCPMSWLPSGQSGEPTTVQAT